VAKCEADFATVLSRERAAAIKEMTILSQSTRALQQQCVGAEKRLSEMVSQYNEAQDSIINLTVRLENTAASLHTCRGMKLKREAEIKRLHDRTVVLQQMVEDAEARLGAVTTEMQNNLDELQAACTVVETDLDLKIGEMKAIKKGHDTEVQHYVKQTRDLNNEISVLSRNLIDLEVKHGKLIWNLMVSRVVNVGLLSVGAATSLYLMFGF
jgi:chromosome segregation ATPase